MAYGQNASSYEPLISPNHAIFACLVRWFHHWVLSTWLQQCAELCIVLSIGPERILSMDDIFLRLPYQLCYLLAECKRVKTSISKTCMKFCSTTPKRVKCGFFLLNLFKATPKQWNFTPESNWKIIPYQRGYLLAECKRVKTSISKTCMKFCRTTPKRVKCGFLFTKPLQSHSMTMKFHSFKGLNEWQLKCYHLPKMTLSVNDIYQR